MNKYSNRKGDFIITSLNGKIEVKCQLSKVPSISCYL